MKSNNIKQHAKDYLSEYQYKKDTPNWLRLLIEKVIDTNGEITQYDKDLIFKELLLESQCNITRSVYKPSQSSVDSAPKSNHQNIKLTIEKITHNKGVNALISDQSIVFSPTCTIIYGLNGTGKSGYFRIIHELAGGEKSNTILGNIYHEQQENLDVEINYLLDESPQSLYKWKSRDVRNIYPFNQIKFFDSDYLTVFLDQRENKINVTPFGLNLFKIIANIIDSFKEKLIVQKDNVVQEKPDLTSLIALIKTQSLRAILQKRDLTEADKAILASYSMFAQEDADDLENQINKKSNFQNEYSEARKKIVIQEKNEVDLLLSHLLGLKNKIEAIHINTCEAIKDYIYKKKIRNDRRKEFDALKNIPGQDTSDWQNFIEAAHSYKDKIQGHNHLADNICLYCQQILNDEALSLTKSYSKFLSDQTQQDYKNAENRINLIKSELDSLLIEFKKSTQLTTMLDNFTLKSESLNSIIDVCISSVINHKTLLKSAIQEKRNIDEVYLLDLQEADVSLTSILKHKEQSIHDIDNKINNKIQCERDMDNKIFELEDKKNVSHWQSIIDKYFFLNHEIAQLTATDKKINTSWVTKLSTEAHEALLTEKLRRSFENELKSLGLKVEVKLDKVKSEKTKLITRLTILKNDVKTILSKGEQKAAALALFFAEITNQGVNSPVVLDDPVDSLDIEYIDFLAKRVLEMSISRQIIIFTHNKQFYDSLQNWSVKFEDINKIRTHHICKNYSAKGCNGAGHHVLTYKVDRESKDRTGKILQTQLENCEYFIEKAELELKRDDFSCSTAAHNLKTAIEYYIDERILHNQGLMKDRRKSESINWNELKKIKVDEKLLDQLKIHYGNLSHRGTHLTAGSTENSLKIEDFKEIIEFIKAN